MTRFDEILYRDKQAGDTAQVPLTRAQVDFHRQGATVKTAVTIPSGPTPVATLVFDPGELSADDKVEAGIGGAILTVSSVAPGPFPNASTVNLVNSTGASVAIAAGTRLILFSRRPSVFSDPTSTYSIGSSALTDDSGRVTCYIPLQRFDYVVRPIGVLAASFGTVTENDRLTWDHPGHALQNAVVVGITWATTDMGEYIASVTYGGVSMTRIGGTDTVDLWRLFNPPAGQKAVEVLFWPSGSAINAVGAAVSLSNVDPSVALTPQTASGFSTSPSVTLPACTTSGLAFGVLGLRNLSSEAVVVPDPPQFGLWSGAAGNSPFIVQGAGAARTATSGNTLLKWSVSPASNWGLIGVELKALSVLPAPRLVIDAEGGTRPNPSWLNLRDFASLADAIAALPGAGVGGEIFIPAGRYKINNPANNPLKITKEFVTLRGEGPSSILEPTNPTETMILVTTVPDSNAAGGLGFRMVDLKLDGTAPIMSTGNSLVVVAAVDDTPPIRNVSMENVVITRSAGHGLELRLVDIFLAINCEFIFNNKSGLFVNGDGIPGYVNATKFIACNISKNGRSGTGLGVDVKGKVQSLDFENCVIANNPGIDTVACDARVDLTGPPTGLKRVGFHQCHFEHNELPAASPAFISLSGAVGTVVDGCWFNSVNLVARAVLVKAGSQGTRVSNCTGWKFPTETGALVEFQAESSPLPAEGPSGYVQFANREIDASGNNQRARIVGPGVFFGLDPVGTPPAGLSTVGGAFLYSYSTSSRPSANVVPAGTMIWVNNTEIQVSDGTDWLKCELT